MEVSCRPFIMETDCQRLTPPGATPPPRPPPGTRLLHIGPHKTGTTAVQGALFAAKDRLPAYGVDFPAHTRHPMEAALAACARPAMMGDAEPTGRHWTRLLDQVRATGGRTSVISGLAGAHAAQAAVREAQPHRARAGHRGGGRRPRPGRSAAGLRVASRAAGCPGISWKPFRTQ
ncbi:hypothetical protein [Streptomyces sp. NPDC052610]|uniref:hypothetical protein n=1 Tax=Streptomyces sp. NPDC052610 TaxID=3154952 RepID=UPI00342A9BEF